MTRTKAYKKVGKLQLPALQTPRIIAEPPALTEINVDETQCRKALSALLSHVEKQRKDKQSTELFSQDEHLFLVVTLKEMYPREKTMPIRLQLPHPLSDPRKQPVCLFVKDPQRQYKDLLEEKKITFVSRVIGVEKLKGKFKPYEARRQLLSTYETFVADDRIIPMLPKLLGKQWIGKHRQPLPIALKRTDLKAELERVLSSTSLFINAGTCTTVRLGTPFDRHSEAELAANLLAVIPQLAVRLPENKQGWANVQALHLKTTNSLSLPIWACDLSVGKNGRFKEPIMADAEQLAIEDALVAVDDKDDSAEEVEVGLKRKRTTAEIESPPKKAKLSPPKPAAEPAKKRRSRTSKTT